MQTIIVEFHMERKSEQYLFHLTQVWFNFDLATNESEKRTKTLVVQHQLPKITYALARKESCFKFLGIGYDYK